MSEEKLYGVLGGRNFGWRGDEPFCYGSLFGIHKWNNVNNHERCCTKCKMHNWDCSTTGAEWYYYKTPFTEKRKFISFLIILLIETMICGYIHLFIK